MKWDDEPMRGFARTAHTSVGRYTVWRRNDWEWIGAHQSGRHGKAVDRAGAEAWCLADHASRTDAVLREAAPHA